jgi:DNA polymerase-3 subunit epsilon
MSEIVEIVLDIETTGLSLNQGHKIIEIGCVELRNRKRTGRIFHQYINPQRKIDPEAINVHGIKDEFLADKPIFAKVAQDLNEFLNLDKNSFIVAHNALAFDIRFINHELAPCGIKVIPQNRVIDSLMIARKKFPGSPASLDALCKRLGVSLDNRKKHGALLDAELLASVYILMQGATQNQILLEALQKESYYNEALIVESSNERTFHLSESDIIMHKDMLQKIREPLWLKQLNSKKNLY